MWRKFLQWLLKPNWVVFTTADTSNPEMGLKIWGVIFALYKAEVYTPSEVKETRLPMKREFGESLHPVTSGNNK